MLPEVLDEVRVVGEKVLLHPTDEVVCILLQAPHLYNYSLGHADSQDFYLLQLSLCCLVSYHSCYISAVPISLSAVLITWLQLFIAHQYTAFHISIPIIDVYTFQLSHIRSCCSLPYYLADYWCIYSYSCLQLPPI